VEAFRVEVFPAEEFRAGATKYKRYNLTL